MEENKCLAKIKELENELKILKEQCEHPGRKYKTGDWVCFNHGEYPKHICQEPWQITHWSYDYDKEGHPMGKIHKSSGMAHSEDCLRFAHPKEIEYYLSGLPYIYSMKTREYETVEIDGEHFKIGNHFNTKDLRNFNGKSLITWLLETEFLNNEGKKYLSNIFEHLK